MPKEILDALLEPSNQPYILLLIFLLVALGGLIYLIIRGIKGF